MTVAKNRMLKKKPPFYREFSYESLNQNKEWLFSPYNPEANRKLLSGFCTDAGECLKNVQASLWACQLEQTDFKGLLTTQSLLLVVLMASSSWVICVLIWYHKTSHAPNVIECNYQTSSCNNVYLTTNHFKMTTKCPQYICCY